MNLLEILGIGFVLNFLINLSILIPSVFIVDEDSMLRLLTMDIYIMLQGLMMIAISSVYGIWYYHKRYTAKKHQELDHILRLNG